MRIACGIAVVALAVTAQVHAQRLASPPRPVLPGSIGPWQHRIRTSAPEAQRLFNQGLTLHYGFNRVGAQRSFAAAAALDRAAAMPVVGLAWSLGPNLNTDASPSDVSAGCAAARAATVLERDARERAYANALVLRYCQGLSHESGTEYAIEMGTLFQASPDDADAATLYAESLLMLQPRSSEQQAELVAVLEMVLARWPTHPGANHYYIHAVEGSASPQRGLLAAKRLETLVPAIGHLLHMPSHIYTRVGDHERAIASNERALAANLAYLKANPADVEYGLYYDHDLESLAMALTAGGYERRARQAASMRTGTHAPGTPAVLGGHGSSPIELFVLLRFGRWKDVLGMPAPPAGDPSRALHHFALATAHVQLKQWAQADAERTAFGRELGRASAKAMYRSNSWRAVLQVYGAVLDARLAGGRADSTAALEAWRRAADAQDRLAYHEPAPVYYPVRESLGAALYRAGKHDEAERVFADDLSRNPRNGRSLFGLWKARVALGRTHDAESAERLFREVWAKSDATLSLDVY
jgi:tetratricopeptide (TPR) repeat protein